MKILLVLDLYTQISAALTAVNRSNFKELLSNNALYKASYIINQNYGNTSIKCKLTVIPRLVIMFVIDLVP